MKNAVKSIICSVFALGLGYSSATSAMSADDPEREQILMFLEDQKINIQKDARNLWDFAELGFKETKSIALIQNRLESEGFKVKKDVAGMPTAFIASYSTGKGPVIGLLAEFDALPGLSQDAVPVRKEIPEKMRGHGCGHNLFAAASTASAIALKNWMEKKGMKGEIRVYGTPAEEGGAGKVFMAREGVFKNVDAVIHWHPFDFNGFYSSNMMSMITGKISFHGISSHAATYPERGRSALDGAQLMNIAVEFMREHIPEDSRIHYIISNGGSTPNVVPDRADVHITVRHEDVAVVKDIWSRIIDASRGAALATGTTTDYEIISGMYPMLVNKTLLKVAEENFNATKLEPWKNEEGTFAEKISKTLSSSKEFTLTAPTTLIPAFPAQKVKASTDVGDVSWVAPTVGIFTMSWVPGTPAHSWQAVAASGTSVGFKGAQVAAEVMTTTAADLFLNPEILRQAKEEMIQSQGKDFVYKPLLGDKKPALNYQDDFAGK